MENSSKKMGRPKGSKKVARQSKGSKKMARQSKGSKKMARQSKGSKKMARQSKGSKKMSRSSKNPHPAFRSKKWAKRGMALESRKILPKPGDDLHLSDYGYSLQKTDKERKASLKRASQGEKSVLPVLRKTNLIRNYTKSVPENYLKLSKDVEFLKKEYKKEKNLNK
jgi:hypothetical protein